MILAQIFARQRPAVYIFGVVVHGMDCVVYLLRREASYRGHAAETCLGRLLCLVQLQQRNGPRRNYSFVLERPRIPGFPEDNLYEPWLLRYSGASFERRHDDHLRIWRLYEGQRKRIAGLRLWWGNDLSFSGQIGRLGGGGSRSLSAENRTHNRPFVIIGDLNLNTLRSCRGQKACADQGRKDYSTNKTTAHVNPQSQKGLSR